MSLRNPPSVTPPWSIIENFITTNQRNGSISPDGFELSYCSYDAMDGFQAGGTWIEYPTKRECLEAFRAIKPLDEFLRPIGYGTVSADYGPVRADKPHCLLFPDLFVRWSEWEDILEKERPANIAQIALSAFSQAFKMVRSQAKKKGNSFASVEGSIGVTKANKVVFVKAPTGLKDYHSNLMDLRNMSNSLAGILTKVTTYFRDRGILNTIYAGIDLLENFRDFIDKTYHKWVRRGLPVKRGPLKRERSGLRVPPIVDTYTRQLVALNHPVWYDLSDSLRLLNNLGRLGDRQEKPSQFNDCNLCRDSFFSYIMDNKIPNWRQDVDRNIVLRQILTYSERSQLNQPRTWMYDVKDLPAYVSNAMKHYWQHASKVGRDKLSKGEVVTLLENVVPGLTCKLFLGYATAVVQGGYIHDPFDVEAVLNEEKGLL